ncbi:MAG: hypothetical protein ABSG90_06550 [Dehalococcoidia bacterium]
MAFYKRHPTLVGLLIFFLFTLPSGIAGWWYIYDKYQEAKMPPLSLQSLVSLLGSQPPLYWISPLIGLMLFIAILMTNRKTNDNNQDAAARGFFNAKRVTVIDAIKQARKNTPKGNDVIVNMSELHWFHPKEIKNILVLLQKEKAIIIISFPNWMLHSKKNTAEIIAEAEPSRQKYFAVHLLDDDRFVRM